LHRLVDVPLPGHADLAALAVDLFVDPLRTLLQVGDDEARVVFGLFAVGTNHLGFKDDAAFSRPRSGRVVDLPVDVLGLPSVPRKLAGLAHGRLGLALQHRIFGHRDDILNPRLGIQKRQHIRMCEAAIEANANEMATPSSPEPTYTGPRDPFQVPDKQ